MNFAGIKNIQQLLKFAEPEIYDDYTKFDNYEEALNTLEDFLSQQNLIKNWTWEDIEHPDYEDYNAKKLISDYGHTANVSENISNGKGIVIWNGKFVFNDQWIQYLNGTFNPEEVFGDAIFYHGSPVADIIQESGFALMENKAWINLTTDYKYALRWANNNKYNVLQCTVNVKNPMPENMWFDLHTQLQEEGYLGPSGEDYDNLVNEGVKRAKELGYDSTYVGNELGIFNPEDINIVGRGRVR